MTSAEKVDYVFKQLARNFRLRVMADEGTGDVWRVPTDYWPTLPSQGLKIHVSFTLLDFADYAPTLVAHLCSSRVAFKMAKNFPTLQALNYGDFGLSQVGKVFTVYPTSGPDFIRLVQEIAGICHGARGPFVLSDRKAPVGSNVYYRFGTFIGDGQSILNETTGVHEPDTRQPELAVPNWADDPFPQITEVSLPEQLIFLETIRQRPKGGVYEGLRVDKEKQQSIPVIIKEARWCGEEDLLGTDAVARLKNQKYWMERLSGRLSLPQVMEAFDHGQDHFLVMTKAPGLALHEWLHTSPSPIVRKRVWQQLQTAIRDLHSAEIYLCDLSADNLVITPDGDVVFTDLELVWRKDLPVLSNYGTPEYIISYPSVFPLGKREAKRRDEFAMKRLKMKLTL